MNEYYHVIYGRVEKVLASGRLPKPGYQLVGYSPGLEEEYADEIANLISFPTDKVARYWSQNGHKDVPVMWSYLAPNSNTRAIVKSSYMRDRLLDQSRIAPVSHAILFPLSTFARFENDPFRIIDQEESLFISSGQDILDLKNNGYDADSELLESLVGYEYEKPESNWDREQLKRMFDWQIDLRQKEPGASMQVTGDPSDMLDFFRTIHSMLSSNSRLEVTFAMNPFDEGCYMTAGSRESDKIHIDASQGKVTIPDDSSDVFFWNEWDKAFPDRDLETTFSQGPNVIRLSRHDPGTPIPDLEELNLSEELIGLYWDVYHDAIFDKFYDTLSEGFSETLVNPFADYWRESATTLDSRKRIIFGSLFDDQDLLADDFYAWLTIVGFNASEICSRSDWNALIDLAENTSHWKLYFLAAAIGTGKRRQIQYALGNMDGASYQDLVTELDWMTPDLLSHPSHLETLVHSVHLGRWSDHQLCAVLSSREATAMKRCVSRTLAPDQADARSLTKKAERIPRQQIATGRTPISSSPALYLQLTISSSLSSAHYLFRSSLALFTRP